MKVVVLGGGESGKGAALLAKKAGFECFLSDKDLIKQEYKDVLDQYLIKYEEGGHTPELLMDARFGRKNPGIPNESEVVTAFLTKGTKVISEIEFGFQHCQSTILAVTGSNGKTTTSALLHHVLKSAGKDVEIAGNFGYSFAGLVAERNPEYIVLEISSFQLDDIETFQTACEYHAQRNTPDHLDRYEYKMKKYVASKF